MPFLIIAILSLSLATKISSKDEHTPISVPAKPAVKVMIIDAQVNTKLGRFKNRVKPYQPNAIPEQDTLGGHGDQVTSVLLFGNLKAKKELCPEVKIIACTTFIDGVFSRDDYLTCLTAASVLGVKYVNVSIQYGQYDATEYAMIKQLTEKGTIVTVAAGNRGLNYNELPSFPAAYDADSKVMTKDADGMDVPLFTALNDNFITVQALDENGKIAKYSNIGEHAVSEYGASYMYDSSGDMVYFGGTSFASPLFLHNMILDEVCGGK